jgi:hypothetical protein
LEKIDSWISNLSGDLNDDLSYIFFGRRGDGLIIKLKVEGAQEKKG